MTAHGAFPLPSLTGAPASRWLALSLGTPAVVAMGFVAGWLLGTAFLRPVQDALLETASA